MKLNRLESAINRENREKLNENMSIIENDFSNMNIDVKEYKETVEENSRLVNQANLNASKAVILANSVQDELDSIVVEGDSSVEAAQARTNSDTGVTYTNLRERLDTENSKTTQQLEQIPIIVASEVFDEGTDSTIYLQSLINKMTDGTKLDLSGHTYRIKKSTEFSSLYPDGDQPCLIVNNKKNVKIINGKLLVKEHGQGAIEFVDCDNWLIEGVEIEGAGNFPQIFGNTGYGEKQSPTSGYYTPELYNSKVKRNNSLDTSAYTTGNYNGFFPQWGGGTATTWGKWNDGFICNYGYGIRGVNGFGTVSASDIHHFNGSGIATLGCNITVSNKTNSHHNYIGGVEVETGIKTGIVYLIDCDCSNNGHPDAIQGHDAIDPGYGFTVNNSTDDNVPQLIIIEKSRFVNNKRKAVDAHSGINVHVYDSVLDGGVYGFAATISGAAFETVIVENCDILNIRSSKPLSGESMMAINISNYQDPSVKSVARVVGNRFKNVGEALPSDVNANLNANYSIGVYTENVYDVTIDGNTFENENCYLARIIQQSGNTRSHSVSKIVNTSYKGYLAKWGLMIEGTTTNNIFGEMSRTLVDNNDLSLTKIGSESIIGLNSNNAKGIILGKNNIVLSNGGNRYSQFFTLNQTVGFLLSKVGTSITITMSDSSVETGIKASDITITHSTNQITVHLGGWVYVKSAQVSKADTIYTGSLSSGDFANAFYLKDVGNARSIKIELYKEKDNGIEVFGVGPTTNYKFYVQLGL